MNDQLTTWDEFRQMLAQAYESASVEYDRIADSLMHGTSRKDALDMLATALAEARENLDKQVNLTIRLTPPESPARPLEAVLADIRAEGHQTIRLSWHHGSWFLDTDTGSVKFDHARQDDPAYLHEYRQTIETALSWGEDPVALAEARLEQIKERREQQRTAVVALVETLTVYPAYPVPLLPPQAQAAAVEAFWASADTRWNVWAKDPDGEWSVTNSNLNQEQALAAIRRLMAAALVHGPAGATFTMLPVGQVPGGPPVDPSDALVFLNPDPEVQPVAGGPTDNEEAPSPAVLNPATQEKSCPECGHPMMSGPLQSKGRAVAWWCANCHHSIEQDAESLARADRERERQASEGDE